MGVSAQEGGSGESMSAELCGPVGEGILDASLSHGVWRLPQPRKSLGSEAPIRGPDGPLETGTNEQLEAGTKGNDRLMLFKKIRFY